MTLNESSVSTAGDDQKYNAQIQALIPQLESLEDQIKDYQIKAPFDGIVSEIYIEEDEYVMPLSPVVQIYENKYYIESSLLEESLIHMEQDAPVEISFDTVFVEGTIRKIYPTIKTVISDLGIAQQKGIVEIASDHEFNLMGREVELKFILDRREGVLTIDKEALFRRGRDYYVFVAVDGRAQLREVTVGAEGNLRSEILEGLEENDMVIISPLEEVEEGDRVSF
jgi:HlyD family secretion protein